MTHILIDYKFNKFIDVKKHKDCVIYFSNLKNINDFIQNKKIDVFILSDEFKDLLYNIRVNPINQNSYIFFVSKKLEFCPCSDILYNDTINKESINKLILDAIEINKPKSEIYVFNFLKKILVEKDTDLKTQLYKVPILTQFIIELLLKENIYTEYLTPKFIAETIKYSAIHDLGKLAVNNEIINFTGKFNDKQRKIMELHTSLGCEIFVSLYNVYPKLKSNIGRNIILYHHEKFDGSGYPENLSGQNIPLEARIVAVADVYDALRSKRKYKSEFSHEKSFEIIKKDSGTHFDPEIIKTLIKYENELDIIYSKLK